jgi:membrane protease YdiL (CAAX protease family)
MGFFGLMKKTLIYLVILSMFLSEMLLLLNPTLGFFIYASLFTGILFVLASSDIDKDLNKILYVFMIFPLIRISQLFLEFDFFWNNLIIYYSLLFLVLFYSFKFKIKIGYTKNNLWLLFLIVPLALSFGLVGNFMLNFEKKYLLFLIIPVIAYSEELLFRGMIENLLEKQYGRLFSIILTSLVYGILMVGLGLYAVLFFFSVSVVSCLIYSYFKNIFLNIAMNFIITLLVFGIPSII